MARPDRCLIMAAAYMVGAYSLYRALASPNTVFSIPLILFTIVYCHVISDAVTVLIHFVLDNYFKPEQPFIGDIVYWFRKHHDTPYEMFDRDFVDNNSSNSAISLVASIIVGPYIVKNEMSFNPYVLSFLYWQGVFFAIMMSVLMTVHKWAHFATWDATHRNKESPKTPKLVQICHSLRIFVDRAHHDAHHHNPRGNYALYAGWTDVFFEYIKFFEFWEAFLFVTIGVCPVNTRLELYEKEQDGKTLWQRWEVIEWKLFYNLMAIACDYYNVHFHGMNWGYLEKNEKNEEVKFLPPVENNDKWMQDEYLQLQNYYNLVRTFKPSEFTNATMADVSCGKGGGMVYLTKLLKPMKAYGFDFTPHNIVLCNKLKQGQNKNDDLKPLEFAVQDACQLVKIPDNSIDFLLSVEASHCYPDMNAFLASSHRVLKKGGHLLITDFRKSEVYQELKQYIKSKGDFEIVGEQDTTQNIVQSMAKDFDRKNLIIQKLGEKSLILRFLKGLLVNFMASDTNCDTYVRLDNKSYTYWVLKLKKL